jgi:hypothetical protein
MAASSETALQQIKIAPFGHPTRASEVRLMAAQGPVALGHRIDVQ